MPRVAEQTEWLSLIDISGPFLAGKVLEEVARLKKKAAERAQPAFGRGALMPGRPGTQP